MSLESGLMMKNKKGFTLIELLAVIVILGILLSISITAVNKIKKNQDVENKENVISSILTGAKSYVSDNTSILDEFTNSTNSISIEVSTFKDKYTDFDESKYNYNSKTVTIEKCNESDLKLKYSIKIDDVTYNDCGCDAQTIGDSAKICK